MIPVPTSSPPSSAPESAGGRPREEKSPVLRAGSWLNTGILLRCSCRDGYRPTNENVNFGFRVASVPEPSALVLTVLFGAACVTRRKR
jgi:formylglycine-generating enzyme required for sulfatase activity